MIVGIIPARFASTRLMGKPLADIGGKPMIQHTYERASKSKFLDDIVIAVDDEKVYNIAKNFGARVVQTPKDVPSGSDRIAIVAKDINADIVVNIQGDEPFIEGKMIDQAIEPHLFDKEVEVSTLAKRIDTVEELKSVTKVVFDYNNYALYFSRAPIPHVRDARTNLDRVNTGELYKHIGLYVFKKDVLMKFTSLEQTDLERIERLEQLRMLENGIRIKIVVTEFDSISVDTQKDLELARKFYEKLKKKK